jgi:hypothetical protein
MIKTFTPNDVIRYAYHETLEDENETIEQILLTDPEMQTLYQDALMLQHQMPRVLMHPPDRVTDRIMAYSRYFSPGS